MSTREPNDAERKAWVKFLNRPARKRLERRIRAHGFAGRPAVEMARRWHLEHSRYAFMWGFDWSRHLAIAYGWRKL